MYAGEMAGQCTSTWIEFWVSKIIFSGLVRVYLNKNIWVLNIYKIA